MPVTLLYSIIGLLVILLVYLLWQQSRKKDTKEEVKDLESFASQLFGDKVTEFMNIASTSFKEREERVQTVFEQIRKDLKEHHEYVDVLDKERIASSVEIKEAIKTNSDLTDRLNTSTEKLHNILSNRRLR